MEEMTVETLTGYVWFQRKYDDEKNKLIESLKKESRK